MEAYLPQQLFLSSSFRLYVGNWWALLISIQNTSLVYSTHKFGELNARKQTA